MGLAFFHEAHDRRAIFLRLYYMMTLEVHAAINGCGDYEGREVFMDPDWVRRLSGQFSSLYFKSLKAPATERAWTLAYEVAARPGSSVVQNALLGINAHINFDLPRAIAENLDPAELSDYTTHAEAQVRPRPGEQPAGPDAEPGAGGPRQGLRARHRRSRTGSWANSTSG